MCNSRSNKIYINESIINYKSVSLVLTLKFQVHTCTKISSQKKKKKFTNHNIVFIILQFDHFMSLYNQNIIVHMSWFWK